MVSEREGGMRSVKEKVECGQWKRRRNVVSKREGGMWSVRRWNVISKREGGMQSEKEKEECGQ